MTTRLLFTAFEPSGDAHAAPVIEALRAARPEVEIVAWGGRKMAAAGAEMMGFTAEDGAMGLNALAKIRSVRGTINAVRAYRAAHDVACHVAVDSPAANFSICRAMQARGTRVVHLVAPQLWAWAPWRARKLRRCTNLVLCLLPHEPAWFATKRIPARFVGHPRMNRTLDETALDAAATAWPDGAPCVALLPGSRTHEVDANVRDLLATFVAIRAAHAGAVGVLAAASDALAQRIRERFGPIPDGVHIEVGVSDAAIRWADLCLAVSGTITLDIARQTTPMVGSYRTTRVSTWLAAVLLTVPDRLLPNIVAGRRIVPEFVPFAGSVQPIVDAALDLAGSDDARAAQRRDLEAVIAAYADRAPDEESAAWIGRVLDGEVIEP